MVTVEHPLVFVSYRHLDDARVSELVDFIRTKGVEVWRDKDNLYDVANWSAEARVAFDAADVLLVCYSASALGTVRGAAFLEWQWFMDSDPNHRPRPVLAQFGDQPAPPSQFIDIEPVTVLSDADHPAVMSALLDAAQGKVRRREIEGIRIAQMSWVQSQICRLFGSKGTPEASRWRDAEILLQIPGVRADLLGEQLVTWRRRYIGRPTYSVLQRDLEKKFPFGLLSTDNDRLGAILNLILDLTLPGQFSADGLGIIGLLESHDDYDGIVTGHVRLAELLFQSLRSHDSVELQYERQYATTLKGQPLTLRFSVCIRVLPVNRLTQALLCDPVRRRDLSAEMAQATCATAGDSNNVATSRVIVHIRYCRSPLVRKGKSLEARVGIRIHERLAALLAAQVQLPNDLRLLTRHTLWKV